MDKTQARTKFETQVDLTPNLIFGWLGSLVDRVLDS